MSGMILVVDYGRTNLRAYLLLGREGDGVERAGNTVASSPPAGEPPKPVGSRVLSRSGNGETTTLLPAEPATSAQILLDLATSLVEEQGLALADIEVAAAGLAGYGREEDCLALEEALRELQSPFTWLVESDARQTLRAAREDGPVVVALLGTGSAFFARDAKGTIHRAGGHGAILEDYGSAFELSRQAILAMMRAYDGMGPASPLFDQILKEAGCEDPLEFRGKLTAQGFTPSQWASFAPLVLEQAERGEPVAVRILNHQLEKVVDTLWALIHKAELPFGTPIYCSGGMVEKSVYYLQRVVEAVDKGLPGTSGSLLESEPYWGGWYRACRWLVTSRRDNGPNSSTD